MWKEDQNLFTVNEVSITDAYWLIRRDSETWFFQRFCFPDIDEIKVVVMIHNSIVTIVKDES